MIIYPPQDSVPWLPFAGTQGTEHNLAANKDQMQGNGTFVLPRLEGMSWGGAGIQIQTPRLGWTFLTRPSSL